MASQTVITITHDKEASADVSAFFNAATNDTLRHVQQVQRFWNGMAGGVRNATVDLQVDGGDSVAASATITFSGVGAANDTILINGVTFTAKASGATGNQWNVGASAAASAANLAAAINASVTSLVSGYVTASDNGAGVVTVSAAYKGIAGNTITIAEGVDSLSAMVVSGARLSGGTAPTANTYHFGI